MKAQPKDIIAKLFQLQSQKASLLDRWISSLCFTFYGAGVETTAITISSLVVQVVNHTGCQDRIYAEICAANDAGLLSNPPQAKEMKEHLPYLNACLSESMRLHHVIGMPMPRIVPEPGCTLDGYEIPAGVRITRLSAPL